MAHTYYLDPNALSEVYMNFGCYPTDEQIREIIYENNSSVEFWYDARIKSIVFRCQNRPRNSSPLGIVWLEC